MPSMLPSLTSMTMLRETRRGSERQVSITRVNRGRGFRCGELVCDRSGLWTRYSAFMQRLGQWQSLDSASLEMQEAVIELGVDLAGWNAVIASRQYRVLADLMQQHVPLDASVLDWGAGRGTFAYWLLRRGQSRVETFDLRQPELLPVLERVGGDRFQHHVAQPQEFTSLPYDAASFDVLTSVGVFEHVAEYGGDEAASLKEIRRVLDPGGLFVCVHLPNEFSWVEALSRRLGRYAHVRRFRRVEMERLLHDAGFEVLAWRTYGMLPRNSSGRLPRRLRNSPRIASAVDVIDEATLRVASRWAQNHAFIARSPAGV